MTRSLIAAAVLATLAAAVVLAYQAAARDRDYRALLLRGQTAQRDDQSYGAIEAYSGAIALRPDSMLAHLRRGETYQRRNELDEAARDFRTAADLDPTATRPLEALGDVLYQLQRFDRSADAYGAYVKLDDRALSVSYKLALARYRAGQLDGAVSTLHASLRLDDRQPDGWYLLGMCLRDTHRLPEALQAYSRAAALAPGLVAAHEELAEMYASLGRHAEQLEQLEVVASLDRDHVERQVALGLAQARSGHEELAILTLGSALARASDQTPVYYALGSVWLERAQARNDRVYLGKALEALGRVAANPSASSEVLALYGRALLLAGQVDAAEQALRQASTRYPLDAAALPLYASAAERSQHFDAARQALVSYTGLLADDAELGPQAIHIAALSMKLRDPETAVAWLQRASARAPDDVRILAPLAEAQLREGDRSAAQATLAHALQRDPSNTTLLALNRRAH